MRSLRDTYQLASEVDKLTKLYNKSTTENICKLKLKEFDKLEEFEAQCDYLHDNSDVLINVVGSNFYDYTPNPGDIVSLLRDEENEHDPDAIAVSVEGKTVGYLANNPYTLMDGVKSASDIKNQIEDNQEAEILFIYLGEYVIAKLR